MKSRKIYNRIALLRHERGMTRKELAEKTGVNFQTIGYLERAEYNPSLDLAFRVSEVFGFPVDFIFSRSRSYIDGDDFLSDYERCAKRKCFH